MSGSGNDFIIIDNRAGTWNHVVTSAFVRAVCRRKISVGADGLIFIERSDTVDFLWRFFNADGSPAEMCGNGGRCAARFAVLNGIGGNTLSFETIAGVVHAEVSGAVVKIQLPAPKNLELNIRLEVDGTALVLHSINTGVPHIVLFVDDLETARVKELGERLRFHGRFQPAGTNVNFVSQSSADMLHIRTYERGVEDETLACGTGSVAAALVAIAMGKAASPVQVMTRSGEILKVHAPDMSPPFHEVYLEGGAKVIYSGEIWDEAYEG